MSTELILEIRQELEELSLEEKESMKERGEKIYVGHETRPGWSGYLPFFIFWCDKCEKYRKDYAHGFDPYLTCDSCHVSYYFNNTPEEKKKREKKGFFAFRRSEAREILKAIEQMKEKDPYAPVNAAIAKRKHKRPYNK